MLVAKVKGARAVHEAERFAQRRCREQDPAYLVERAVMRLPGPSMARNFYSNPLPAAGSERPERFIDVASRRSVSPPHIAREPVGPINLDSLRPCLSSAS